VFFLDIVKIDFDVLVTIRPALLVIEADGVKHFVQNGSHINAAFP
jgi:hypothetical protein